MVQIDFDLLGSFLRSEGLFCRPGLAFDFDGTGEPAPSASSGAAPVGLLQACGVSVGEEAGAGALYRAVAELREVAAGLKKAWETEMIVEVGHNCAPSLVVAASLTGSLPYRSPPPFPSRVAVPGARSVAV